MRQTAKHVWIKELLDGEYEEREGWEPNLLHTARGPVSRVNLLGVLVSQGSDFLLDDGTGQLNLRTFDYSIDHPPGTFVTVIGRPRVYQDNVHLVVEIAKPIDPEWGAIRKLELGEAQTFQKKETTKPETSADNKADLIIQIINGLDTGDGVDVQKVIDESGLGDVAEQILDQLMLDGEVFELKPGIVKVL